MGWPLGWGNSARCAPNYLVNIAARQSLAVRSAAHVPVVFDQPARFTREAFHEERDELNRVAETGSQSNGPRLFTEYRPQRSRCVIWLGKPGELQLTHRLWVNNPICRKWCR